MNRNAALYIALRAAERLIRVIPLSVVYGLASFAGTVAYYTFREPRAVLARNLAAVFARPVDHPVVLAAVRNGFRHDAKNWVDTLRIGSLTADQLQASVSVDGWDNLERAVARGRGALLFSLHLGNFDLVGQSIASRGYRMTVPVARMEPEKLFNYLVERRESHGISVVPVDEAPRRMIRALRAGEVVGMTVDRAVAGRVVPVTLFGMKASLPAGPVSLARHSGAPALLAVGIRLPDNRFAGFISEPLAFQFTGDASADDAANQSILVSQLEHWITAYPDQWLAFEPLEAEHRDAGQTATMSESFLVQPQRERRDSALRRVVQKLREKGRSPHVTIQDQHCASTRRDGS